MPQVSLEVMESMLLGNMRFKANGGEPTYAVDPLTLALRHGWDFDIASPPNLIERKGEIQVGRFWILPDQSQPGYCYVFDSNWESVFGGEWDTPEEALSACKTWAEQN